MTAPSASTAGIPGRRNPENRTILTAKEQTHIKTTCLRGDRNYFEFLDVSSLRTLTVPELKKVMIYLREKKGMHDLNTMCLKDGLVDQLAMKIFPDYAKKLAATRKASQAAEKPGNAGYGGTFPNVLPLPPYHPYIYTGYMPYSYPLLSSVNPVPTTSSNNVTTTTTKKVPIKFDSNILTGAVRNNFHTAKSMIQSPYHFTEYVIHKHSFSVLSKSESYANTCIRINSSHVPIISQMKKQRESQSLPTDPIYQIHVYLLNGAYLVHFDKAITIKVNRRLIPQSSAKSSPSYLDITPFVDLGSLLSGQKTLDINVQGPKYRLSNAHLIVEFARQLSPDSRLARTYYQHLKSKSPATVTSIHQKAKFDLKAMESLFDRTYSIGSSSFNHQNKQNKADDDLEVGQQVVSLKCPLTMKRLSHPAKLTKCTHYECFDFIPFIEFNVKKPLSKWKCIACNATLKSLNDIVMDPFMKHCLKIYPEEDKIAVNPDGSTSRAPQRKSQAIEIDHGKSGSKRGIETVIIDDNEKYEVAGSKRGASAMVIDLCSDGECDQALPRKRSNIASTLASGDTNSLAADKSNNGTIITKEDGKIVIVLD
ncbi:hypothetical protein BKA69DRAFT_1164799 [Paraphysoderma sedebokerense]|nr:hypothetical protein BKA69DRAFT_1164799 [Paraphysoderma sedebokerense]